VLAVDIGGTKMAAARSVGGGRLEQRREVATPAGDDPEGVFAALTGLLATVADGSVPAVVGVGCGGPMTWPDGVVSPLNLPAWRAFPLRARLEAEYPGCRVVVHNDAVAMALGEHRYGAGRDCPAFLGVVVSTGVGGGLVLGGRPLDGPTGNAGHVGHVVVDPHGPPCECGGRGCLEAIARGPATVAWAADQGWQAEVADGRSLVASADAGDPVALAALTRAGNALGVALASVAATLDLDLVAVGGGLAHAGDLLLEPARAAFARHAGLDFARRCRIVAAELGRDAGLVGAGELARLPDAAD
jgi:glucokinase